MVDTKTNVSSHFVGSEQPTAASSSFTETSARNVPSLPPQLSADDEKQPLENTVFDTAASAVTRLLSYLPGCRKYVTIDCTHDTLNTYGGLLKRHNPKSRLKGWPIDDDKESKARSDAAWWIGRAKQLGVMSDVRDRLGPKGEGLSADDVERLIGCATSDGRPRPWVTEDGES